jgi:hypothetical protein
MQKLFCALALFLLLGGCATFEKGVLVARQQVLTSPEFAEMTLKDVENAGKLALLTDDKLSILCWDYIEDFVRTHAPEAGVETGEVVGPLSAYQKARNIRRTVVDIEISDPFRVACGPMLTDSMSMIGKIGIRIAL